MTIAATALTRLAYIAESAFGVTPTTPTFKEMRRTSGGLELRKGTVISDQVSSRRDVMAEPQVSQDVTGNIAMEVSHATLDDFLQAVLGGSWSSNVLKTGSTLRSFTFEETIPVGVTNHYLRFPGCAINTMELSFNARQKVTGSIGIMGKLLEDPATAIISGATYTAANTEPLFTADKVASLSILGNSLPVRSLSLSINNNLRLRPTVGSLYTEEFGQGLIEITGRADVYFDSATLLEAILDHSAGALSFTVGVDANKKYTFSLPNAQIGNGSANLGGRDDDVMVPIDFRALYDTSAATSMAITRVVA